MLSRAEEKREGAKGPRLLSTGRGDARGCPVCLPEVGSLRRAPASAAGCRGEGAGERGRTSPPSPPRERPTDALPSGRPEARGAQPSANGPRRDGPPPPPRRVRIRHAPADDGREDDGAFERTVWTTGARSPRSNRPGTAGFPHLRRGAGAAAHELGEPARCDPPSAAPARSGDMPRSSRVAQAGTGDLRARILPLPSTMDAPGHLPPPGAERAYTPLLAS